MVISGSMGLKEYGRKRDFDQTPEPSGRSPYISSQSLRFVVQYHEASRSHFDFRLEMEGLLKSWAVPKGPSLNPSDKRMAVWVEDHPVDYGAFEGVIPPKNYGAGPVMLWDSGVYWDRHEPDRVQGEAALLKGLAKGKLSFILHGHKLKGEFALVRTRSDKEWILMKKADEYASYEDILRQNRSVKSGRSIEEIEQLSAAENQIWLPTRGWSGAGVLSWVRPPAERFDYKGVSSSLRKKKEARGNEGSKQSKAVREKFPHRLRPMLPTQTKIAFKEKDWVYQPFHRGLRAIAELEKGKARMHSKQLLSYNTRFSEICHELAKSGLTAVLDGEIVKEKEHNIFYVYDLLHLKGENLRQQPLKKRLKVLKELSFKSPCFRLTKTSSDPAQVKCSSILARDLSSLYRSGTSDRWVRIDLPQEEDLARKEYKTGEQRFVNLAKGLRLTHLDKVYWPDEGITKGDVIEYYDSISSTLLPHLKDHPLSLNRHPNGIHGESFFQKDLTGHVPRFVETQRIASTHSEKNINFMLCQNRESLLYMANLGCIEINPWLSRYYHLDHPDYLVIDLDPNGRDFSEVVEVANELHRVLEVIGARDFVKTSGSSGIHICVPTAGKFDYDLCREFALQVCRKVLPKFSDKVSLERDPSRRRGKIYLDCLQNRRGQTLASVYCLRPRPYATVSTPLHWDEVRADLNPQRFTLRSLPARLEELGDLWKDMLTGSVNIQACLSKL